MNLEEQRAYARANRRRAKRLTTLHPILKDVRHGAICCGRCVWGEDVGVWEHPTGYYNYVCLPACEAVQCAPRIGQGDWPDRVLL